MSELRNKGIDIGRIMEKAHNFCPHGLPHLDKMRWMAQEFVTNYHIAQPAAHVSAPTKATLGDVWASGGVHWDLFPGYLIDHREGDVLTEEGLQFALAAMLKDADYLRIVAERKSQPAPVSAHVATVIGNDHVIGRESRGVRWVEGTTAFDFEPGTKLYATPVAVAPSPAGESLSIGSTLKAAAACCRMEGSTNLADAVLKIDAALATHRQPEDGDSRTGEKVVVLPPGRDQSASESIASNEFLGKLLAWINVRHDRTRDEAAYNAIIDHIHSWRERTTKEASVQGVAEGGSSAMQAATGAIPTDVFYAAEYDNFYYASTHGGCGIKFYQKWRARRAEFPQGAAPRGESK